MATANLGPFKYIGAVNFPDDDPGGGGDGDGFVTFSPFVLWGFDAEHYPDLPIGRGPGLFTVFYPDLIGSAHGGPYAATIVATVSPQTLSTSYEDTDPDEDGWSVMTKQTGWFPSQRPGAYYIDYVENYNTQVSYSGSVLTHKLWTVVARLKHGLFGIAKEELQSVTESSVDFECSTLRVSDGHGREYAGDHWTVDGRLICRLLG